MTNPNEWLTVGEKVFNKAVGYGIAVLVLTLPYLIAYRSGWVDKSDVTKTAFDVCQIAVYVSGSLIALGIVIALLRTVGVIAAWPFKYVEERRSNKAQSDLLHQNVMMARKESLVLLMYFNGFQHRRFRSPGAIPPIKDLIAIKAVVSDKPEDAGWEANSEFLKVNPLLNLRRLETSLDIAVRQIDPSVKDGPSLHAAVDKIMISHGCSRR